MREERLQAHRAKPRTSRTLKAVEDAQGRGHCEFSFGGFSLLPTGDFEASEGNPT